MKSLKRVNIYLLVLAFVYNMLDAWHTQLLLATGLIYETNPMLDYCIKHFGIYSLYMVKACIFLILFVGIIKLHRMCNERL